MARSDDGEIFPWPDVDASRANRRLQDRHGLEGPNVPEGAKSCPGCGAAARELSWFWFESPDWTWERLCGRAGWMGVCDDCRVQVNFVLRILS